MHLPGFLASRESLPTSTSEIYEARCRSFLPQFKWCPIDVALWVLLIVVIFLTCWFVYSTKRGGRSTRSNNKLYRRLSLPYPASGSLEFAQYSGYDYDTKRDSANSSATLIDPFHVVDKLDNSLIAEDISFNAASLPQPTLDQKKTEKLASGLGLGIIMDGDLPQRVNSSQKSSNENEKTATPPPEQAHVRQAWWDS